MSIYSIGKYKFFYASRYIRSCPGRSSGSLNYPTRSIYTQVRPHPINLPPGQLESQRLDDLDWLQAVSVVMLEEVHGDCLPPCRLAPGADVEGLVLREGRQDEGDQFGWIFTFSHMATKMVDLPVPASASTHRTRLSPIPSSTAPHAHLVFSCLVGKCRPVEHTKIKGLWRIHLHILSSCKGCPEAHEKLHYS